MGLTPLACLTRLRLHRVRRALLAATHGSATVADLASPIGKSNSSQPPNIGQNRWKETQVTGTLEDFVPGIK
jgi:hypothetical protein